ncbi:MAG TPA: allantoinase AllB [Candidatus Limnocylindrales bacterium]|nr:allantoinase AllB [Candidatus Limnocylindrales bacterium]
MANAPNSLTPSAANLPDLIVRGKRVVTPEGEHAAAIHVRGGTITAITGHEDAPAGAPIYEAGESVVMPGLVDTHVHINEPGRTEWEGFTTATQAAAAGGVTTLVEMPLNSIPATTTAVALREKLAATAGKLWVDVGFWGGVVPGNLTELRPLWEAGVWGFKCFLVPSGVEEFAHVGEGDLRAALPELAALGAPLLAHAEMPGLIAEAAKRIEKADAERYATWLASRPNEAENKAIELLVKLCREIGTHVHVVHLSSAGAIPQLREAKAEGLPVSVETCPHYLIFAAEEIKDGATEFKCAPPIRARENREKLWQALGEGVIDFVVTDHSPCPPAMKRLEEGDFLRAWGGIASLELRLAAVWTEARRRGYAVARICKWLCEEPARFAGLEKQKGAIAVGRDADFVIWNPDTKFTVKTKELHQRHKITPYAGREMTGVVETTFLRGRKIYDRGEFSAAPIGRVLRRGDA